jgi:hypothetical protein
MLSSVEKSGRPGLRRFEEVIVHRLAGEINIMEPAYSAALAGQVDAYSYVRVPDQARSSVPLE